jgi:hypothetical protein
LRATIFIDALDESGGDGRMISLLIGREDRSSRSINIIIVTTRPEPALLSPLRSHWKREQYQEFTPSELRTEVKTRDTDLSPLLRTLIALIKWTQPDLITSQSEPRDLNTAYDLIFDRVGLTSCICYTGQ